MNGRKVRIKVLVWSGVLLAACVAMLCFLSRDRLAAKVDRIIKRDMMPAKNTNPKAWKAGMDELWGLGPGIIPYLAADADPRDTILSRNYPVWFRKFPPGIQRYLPPPVDRVELRATAIRAIAEFGPLAARGAAPQVIARLGDRNKYYPVQALRWLLPESTVAINAFKQDLAGDYTNWNFRDTYFKADKSVWAKMPTVVPVVMNSLANAGSASEAATALGYAGSNAASAIPALIQTIDLGAAGSFTNAEAARFYSVYDLGTLTTNRQDNKGMNQNRAMAALALGRIGVATPEVRAALVRAWNSADAGVRQNAALAVALLGPPMTNDLPGLLTGLPDPDNAALDNKLRAIAKLGPGAREAIARLREFTETNRLRTLVTDPDSRVSGWSVDGLAVTAKMAICRLDPAEGRPFLPEIASRIRRQSELVEFLVLPGPLSKDIVRAVEPLLDQTNVIGQSVAAYVILCHEKNHSRALAMLRRNESVGELNYRLVAGRLLFESTGETNGLCSLISEGIESPKSDSGRLAGQLAEKMGTAAMPALPAIRAALWHKDMQVRNWAGELVIKLAPGEIPIKGGE